MDKQVERELREVFGIVERTPLEAMVWKDCGTQIAPGRMGYRTQTIKAGRMLEINCYPLLGRSQEAKAGRRAEQDAPRRFSGRTRGGRSGGLRGWSTRTLTGGIITSR